MIDALRTALQWKPASRPEDDGHRISRLEEEISQLRKDRREIQSRVDAARQFSKRAGGFESEALEQKDRLASIKALPKNPETGEWQWPFCEANLALMSPVAKVLLNELATRRGNEHRRRSTPQMEAYLAEQGDKVRESVDAIKSKEAELSPRSLQVKLLRKWGRATMRRRGFCRIIVFRRILFPTRSWSRARQSTAA